MKTRKLGWTDLNLSVIGLGTWAIGGPWTWGWGPQDDTESIATISRALEMRVNWIDTAPVYGLVAPKKLWEGPSKDCAISQLLPPSAVRSGMRTEISPIV